jgi:predicted alpha/beta-hydrolase family hydrolase
MDTERIRFVATPSRGEVGGLLSRPADARALLVLAHGAGAGMEHPFMAAFAGALAGRGVAVLRYQFPYVEAGKKSPDPAPVLEASVRSAVAAGARAAPDLPRFAGGKSMGGRMTSRAASAGEGLDARGVVFVGFPLHAAGKPPGVERAAHLQGVPQPLLFLQGTRDALADLGLMRGVCEALGERATLHVVDGADHGFHVPRTGPHAKRGEGRDDGQVIEELADVTARWIDRVLASG